MPYPTTKIRVNATCRKCTHKVHRMDIFFFQAEDGIRDHCVTGVQTCALPILTPTGTIQDGNGDANYQVTIAASHAGSITPRPLNVSATGVNKQYDGLTTASVQLTDDRLSGEDRKSVV